MADISGRVPISEATKEIAAILTECLKPAKNRGGKHLQKINDKKFEEIIGNKNEKVKGSFVAKLDNLKEIETSVKASNIMKIFNQDVDKAAHSLSTVQQRS